MTTIVCVRCGQDVRGPVKGAGGVKVHVGHVDARLNKSCWTWGFKRVPIGGKS